MIDTYLFERNDLLREGLKSYLAGTNFHVVGECAHISEYNAADTSTPPDVAITGVNHYPSDIPQLEFQECIQQFRDCCPSTRLVILASIEEIRLMPEILDCNAEGYIMRDVSREAILSYLELAMLGEKALPSALATLLCTPHAEPGSNALISMSANATPVLSERENDVLQCLMLGESNKTIARHLDITESTVKGHLKIILRKLGVQNRTQAAMVASKCSADVTALITSIAA